VQGPVRELFLGDIGGYRVVKKFSEIIAEKGFIHALLPVKTEQDGRTHHIGFDIVAVKMLHGNEADFTMTLDGMTIYCRYRFQHSWQQVGQFTTDKHIFSLAPISGIEAA